MSPEHVFVVYGSLAPGRPNHKKLSQIEGVWKQGSILGKLESRGWGSAMGYPGYVKSDASETIHVYLLFSEQLPDHWPQLDAFEGHEYERTVIEFTTLAGEVGEGYIYALKE